MHKTLLYRTHDAIEVFVVIKSQLVYDGIFNCRNGYKPKAIMKKRLYLLQGLPMGGANIANKMLERFGSIENMISASVDGD
jgi:ERCC4-type nuclease